MNKREEEYEFEIVVKRLSLRTFLTATSHHQAWMQLCDFLPNHVHITHKDVSITKVRTNEQAT